MRETGTRAAGTDRRRLLVLAATAATVSLVMAGCTAQPVDPQPDASDLAIDRPIPLLDLDCSSLIDQSIIDTAFTPSTVPVPLSFDGSGSYYPIAQIGLEQAGALRCEWSNAGAAESYLALSVLPDAAESWAQFSPELAIFQPSADSYGDASWHDCQASSGSTFCRVDVLIDGHWLSAVLGGLADTDAAATVIEAAVSAVREAGPVDQSWTTTATAPADCDTLLPNGTLNTALGTELGLHQLSGPTQPILYHAGFLAADGLHCYWRNSFDSASAMTVDVSVLPGGGWAWPDYWRGEASALVTRDIVADLGDDAWAGCHIDASCWVSVLAGDTWLGVSVNDESSLDERDRAIAIARTALESLNG